MTNFNFRIDLKTKYIDTNKNWIEETKQNETKRTNKQTIIRV